MEECPWHTMDNKRLDKILSVMVMAPKWEKASKIIAKHLIPYITELKETKSVLAVLLSAKENGEDEKVIYGMTTLASQSEEAKKSLLSVNAADLFIEKINNFEDNNKEILKLGIIHK